MKGFVVVDRHLEDGEMNVVQNIEVNRPPSCELRLTRNKRRMYTISTEHVEGGDVKEAGVEM